MRTMEAKGENEETKKKLEFKSNMAGNRDRVLEFTLQMGGKKAADNLDWKASHV